MMDKHLITLRLKSFGYNLGTAIALSLLAFFVSDEFASIVKESFGQGAVGTLVLLLVTEGAKHARNLMLMKKSALGSTREGVHKGFDLI